MIVGDKVKLVHSWHTGYISSIDEEDQTIMLSMSICNRWQLRGPMPFSDVEPVNEA